MNLDNDMDHNEEQPPDTPVKEIIQAETGYDKQEPKAGIIAGLTVATFVALIAVILGVQAYFDNAREAQIFREQQAPIADDLKNLRNAEDEALNSYKVIDKQNKVVQIPIKRAMELVAKEAAEGKLQYAQKTYPVKLANAAAPVSGSATPAPAAAPAVKANGSTNNAPAAKP